MEQNIRKQQQAFNPVDPENMDNYIDNDNVDDMDSYDDEEPSHQQLLPGIRDPKMWQVRVKKNHERTAVIALLNKSMHF